MLLSNKLLICTSLNLLILFYSHTLDNIGISFLVKKFIFYLKKLYIRSKSEVKVLVTQLCPALCDPMDYSLPGKNTGVGCHSLLQEIFPAQQSNTGLPHCRQILCHLSHQCHRDSLILRVGSLADEAHSISSVQFSSVVQSCLTL